MVAEQWSGMAHARSNRKSGKVDRKLARHLLILATRCSQRCLEKVQVLRYEATQQ